MVLTTPQFRPLAEYINTVFVLETPSMSQLRAIKSEILVHGEDLRIDDADFATIRSHLGSGEISDEDFKVLAEMRTDARVVCDAFDKFFFPLFKKRLLADGRISSMEQFELLRMLYGGGGIDANERDFLTDLRNSLQESSPEFEALYHQAMLDAR